MPVVGPDEWRRVDNLFQAALDHTPAERAVFLAKACAGDDQLRQTVAGLLASFEEAGGFLETPAALDLLTVNFLAQTPEKIDLPPDPVVKRRLGHFEILSKLGAGGMGEVYLAHDIQLDRRVALKILPAHFSTNPQWAKRFEREARAASTLNHPNIITIYEIGREGPINYIAAEFIDGHTLRRKIGGEKLAVREAVTIAVQMAGALGAAHAAGVVHRDVKPENVMVRPDGLVKVLDFGLAKPIAGMTHEPDGATAASRAALGGQTDPECLMGTIHYLSPEQILKREVDHRTDIFSFGVVLYEMVAGQRPFTGPGAAAVCGAILRSAPPPIGVPHNLQRIIGRALAKDRESRYQTADEMRDDLQRFLHETDAGRVGRHGAKRWIKFALACVGMLVAVAALVLAPRMRRAGGHEAERPRFSIDAVTRITDTGGQEIFPSLSPDGGSVLYASRAAGNWDIYLRRKGERQVHNLTSDSPGLDLAPTFSPDGKRIAFHSARGGGGIYLMDGDGKNVERLSAEGHNPAWSPDGREIAVGEDRVFDYEGRNHNASRLWAIDVTTKTRRLLTDRDAVQPNWSPHGHQVAYWGVHKGGQRDIWVVAAGGGKEPVAVTDDKAVDWNPVWGRDGRHLYFLSNRAGSMNLWRVAIDESAGRITGPPEPATLPSANSQHISFSGDGRALVYVEMNRQEATWQIPFDPAAGRVTGPEVQITHGVRRYSNPDLAPDEKSIVFVSQGEAQEDLYVVSRDGMQLRQLTNDPFLDRSPRWSPDGRRIAFVSDRSGKYEVWGVNDDGSDLARLTDVGDAEVISPVWSPDGRRLLYQARGVNSFVIEVGRGAPGAQTPQPLPGQQTPGFLPWSWSPDGSLLAGWTFKPNGKNGVVIYSFAAQSYRRVSDRGRQPIWLNDNRRLIYVDLGKMYLLDTLTGRERPFYSIDPDNFGTFMLSPDNRRLYFSRFSSEADVWLLSLD